MNISMKKKSRWDNRPPELERFLKWVNVKGPNECWEWTGARRPYGYGAYLRERAHRAAYRLFKGPINGMWVLHKCDNPPCCNPNHLYLGTPMDNMRDCISRGRRRNERGVDRYCAKLNDNAVREILQKLSTGEPIMRIARHYGVSRMAIYMIKYGKRWKHIPRI